MCLGPAPQPATQKAAFYQKLILVIMIILLGIIIINFIAGQIMPGFFGIMLQLVLFMCRRQMNHQLIMIFIFFSIYFGILFLVQFLTPIQNQKDFSKYTGEEKFRYATYVISFVFYTTCAIVLFYPYREFKGIEFARNPALAEYFDNGRGNNEENNEENKKKDKKKVQNVEEENNFNVDYGDFNYKENKQNKNKGEFKVFQGQGVKIG